MVWEARQLSLDRLVAVKVYQRGLDEGDRRRLLGEAAAAGRLSGHPGVITTYDAGVLPDERPYLIMELCPDGSLTQWLKPENRPTEERVREVGVRVADTLAAAHTAGVLHRDVKPANILMDRYGNPRLADFGLAVAVGRAPAQEALRLTLAYAPPEAFETKGDTDTGDVYSLAATLYALLAGSPPRRVDPAPAALEQMVELAKRPADPLPGVNWYLMDALLVALRHDPAARPTAAQFRDLLTEVPAPRSGRRGLLVAATGDRFAGFSRKLSASPRQSATSNGHGPAATEATAAAPRAAHRWAAAKETGGRDRRRWGILASAAVLVTVIASGTAWLVDEPASSRVPAATMQRATTNAQPASTSPTPDSRPASTPTPDARTASAPTRDSRPASAPTQEPGPGESTGSGAAAEEPFRLQNSAHSAKPHETVRIHGTYRGGAGTLVTVQRWDRGRWRAFPLPTRTDRSGKFTAYVELGQSGRHRLRLLDPESGVTSKAFVLMVQA